MFTSTITSRGQVTIPKKVRMALNLRSSEKVRFYAWDKKIIIEPIPDFLSLGGNFQTTRKAPSTKKLRKYMEERIAHDVINETR
ncbi:MAG: AbrB/MazE/SpoVT family DNA-binding domain-containing protein [Candidatus Portnoybacteria bacterium]|nr:AbrB/MazE/SpoVT family DNA-binding domain-containing protein [Candidatus Portnoybacteria bacterium]